MTIATSGPDFLDDLEGDVEYFEPADTTDFYYAILPLWILERASGEAIKLYAILSTYLNPTSKIVWPSRQTLADRLGKSRPESIDRYLNELSEIGALEVIARYREDGGRTSNAYRILRVPPRGLQGSPPPPKTAEAPPLKTADKLRSSFNLEKEDPRKLGSSPAPAAVNSQSPIVENAEQDVLDLGELAPVPGSGLVRVEADPFDEFWAVYPRKDDKKKARLAYAKALRVSTVGEILEGARRYAADPNRESRYTRHATTWLNNESWGNEPLPARRDGRDLSEKLAATAQLTGSMVAGWNAHFGPGEGGATAPLGAIDSTRLN